MVKLDLSTHPPTTIKFTVCYICLFTLRGKKIPGDVHQKFWINLCTTYTGVQIYPSQSYSSDSFSNPASHIVQSSWPLVIISITLQEQIPVSLEIMNCFHFTLVEMLTEWGGGEEEPNTLGPPKMNSLHELYVQGKYGVAHYVQSFH